MICESRLGLSELRELDAQIVPCAVPRVANWISDIRSKRVSIVGWYMRAGGTESDGQRGELGLG